MKFVEVTLVTPKAVVLGPNSDQLVVGRIVKLLV